MKRSMMMGLAATIFACAGWAGQAQALEIYKSANMGPLNATGGLSLLPDQYLGAQFSLTTGVQVTAVGGNIGGDQPGTLFAAILSLPPGATKPSDNPYLESSVVASTLFTPPALTNGDIRTPLNVFLPAGNYELVFGAGRYGATGTGYMPYSNTQAGSDPNTAVWFTGFGGWEAIDANATTTYLRFVVEGNPVPEVGTLSALAVGTAALLRKRR